MIRLTLLALLLAACSSDPAGDAPSDGGPTGGVPDFHGASGDILLPDAEPDVPPHTGCSTHDDCGSRFCERTTGSCIDCLLAGHCPDGQVCREGACAEATPCTEDAECGDAVCEGGVCADCRDDADCAGACVHRVCMPGVVPCDAAADCAPFAMSCNTSKGHCQDCLVSAHCPLEGWCDAGICAPDVCVPGAVAAACSGEVTIDRCRDDGSGFEEVACEAGERCEPAVGGAKTARCADVICTPGERSCKGDGYSLCNQWGTSLLEVPCPAGTGCVDGECRPPKPLILLVFDTSSSMWGYPTGGIPDLCEQTGATCVPPWPTCEAGSDGLTLMGRSKLVFASLFEAFSDKAHFALMRFPQREKWAPTPACKTGWYAGQETIEGDPSEHTAPAEADGWFARGLEQVLLAPVPKSDGESNLDTIQSWLDFTETVEPHGGPCASDDDCEGGFCGESEGAPVCMRHSNPELRPTGYTPLGRSLFYAGEYLRQRVVVDGRSCVESEDCGTPLHQCDGGVCRDPGRGCRPILVLLFTDGSESVDVDLQSWFHPRNQAKRLHFGLGCASDADCASGATCAGGTCQSAKVSLEASICTDTGAYCQKDADCPGGTCAPDENTFVDPDGVQRLVGADGLPIVVTVSVVTVGYDQGQAAGIAAWGGGDYVNVPNADAQVLLESLSQVVSAKINAECEP